MKQWPEKAKAQGLPLFFISRQMNLCTVLIKCCNICEIDFLSFFLSSKNTSEALSIVVVGRCRLCVVLYLYSWNYTHRADAESFEHSLAAWTLGFPFRVLLSEASSNLIARQRMQMCCKIPSLFPVAKKQTRPVIRELFGFLGRNCFETAHFWEFGKGICACGRIKHASQQFTIFPHSFVGYCEINERGACRELFQTSKPKLKRSHRVFFLFSVHFFADSVLLFPSISFRLLLNYLFPIVKSQPNK